MFFWHLINKTLQFPTAARVGASEGLLRSAHFQGSGVEKARYDCSHKCQSDGMDDARRTGEMTSKEYSMNFDFFFFFSFQI